MKTRIQLICKFFLLLLLFGVQNNEIHAEMFQIGTKWYYNKQSLTSYPSHGYVVYEVVGDTLIENKSCKQVLSTSVSADGSTSKQHDKFIFYENSKSIYYYLNGKFDLMYDFGLNKGDELKVKILSDASNNPVSPLIIDSTSTIQVNGQTLKVQYVSWSYMDPFQNVIVKGERKLIESIGNEDAFLFTPSCLQSEYFAYLGLRCVSSSNMSYTSPYWSNHFKDYSCDQVVPGATSTQYKSVLGSQSTSWNQYFQMTSRVWTDSLFVTGDTIINSMPYKIIGLLSLHEFTDGYYYLRETSDRSKVYQYLPEKYFSNMTNGEFLVMDLNLKVNDSFPIEEGLGNRSIIVDSVFFDKNKSKHIRFSTKIIHPLGEENFEFIEGIGSNLGLFYKVGMFEYAAFLYNYLLCSHHNDSIAYYGKLAKNNCNFYISTGLKEIKQTQSVLVSFDKPTNQLIIKSTNGAEQDYAIALYSANGTLLKRIDEVTLPASVSLSNLSNGVYIVSLKTATNIVNRKIVINRY